MENLIVERSFLDVNLAYGEPVDRINAHQASAVLLSVSADSLTSGTGVKNKKE